MPIEVADNNDVILEVNAGVGGQEAMLFAKEVLAMYLNYATFCGWQVEVINSTESDQGDLIYNFILIKWLIAKA